MKRISPLGRQHTTGLGLTWRSLLVLTLAFTSLDNLAPSGIAAIKPAPTIKLSGDFQALKKAWEERVLLAPMRTRVHGKAWADEAAAFANQVLEIGIPQVGQRGRPHLSARGEALLASGCDDPLISFFSACLTYNASVEGNWHFSKLDSYCFPPGPSGDKACDQMVAAAKKLEDLPAPGGLQRIVACSLIDLYTRADKTKEIEQWNKRSIECMRLTLLDGSYKAGEEELFVRHLSTLWLGPNHDALGLMIDAAEIPDWVKHLTRSRMLRYRWGENGRQPSGPKKEAGFSAAEKELLQKNIQAELEAAWKEHPESPSLMASIMIFASRTKYLPNNDSKEVWLQRTIDHAFDYIPAYDEYISLLSTAMWTGERWNEEQLALGLTCAATGRFDTAVPAVLDRAVPDHFAGQYARNRKIFQRLDVRAALKSVTDHYLSSATDPDEKEYWCSRAALYAWLAGDYAEAAKHLAELGDKLPLQLSQKLSGEGYSEVAFHGDIAARVSPAKKQFAQAEDFYSSGDLDQAKPLYEEALKLCSGSEPAETWVKARLQLVAFEQQYRTDVWTPVPVDAKLSNWCSTSGNWESKTAGELAIHGTNQTAIMIFQGRVGYAYEVRGRVNSPEEEKPASPMAYGMVLQYRDLQEFYTLQVKSRQGHFNCTLLKTFYSFNFPRLETPQAQDSSFYIRLEDRHVTFDLNDQRLLDRTSLLASPTSWDPGRIGFAGNPFASRRKTAFSGIEVRRLPGGEPPAERQSPLKLDVPAEKSTTPTY